jgi:hypothetical protein
MQKSLRAGLGHTAHGDVESATHAAATPASNTVAAASPAAVAVAATAKSAVVAAVPAATTAAKRAHATHRAMMSKGQDSSSSSSQTLSTGPLSLKRLLKDFNSYESAFGAFFGDDKHAAHTRPRFAQAHLKDRSKLDASYEHLRMQQVRGGIMNMETSVGE